MTQHSSVGERLDQIEHRLDRVESAHRTPSTGWWDIQVKKPEDKIRMLGWAVTTFSLLGFLTGWTNYAPVVGLFFSIALAAGLVTILAVSDIFTPSESSLHLAQEHRASRKLLAHDSHKPTWMRKAQGWWQTSPSQVLLALGFFLLALLVGWGMALVTDTLLQVVPAAFGLILLGVHTALGRRTQMATFCLVALTILLSVTASPVIVLATALAGCGVIWIAAWEAGECELAIRAGAALVLISFAQTYWSTGALDEVMRASILSGSLMGLVLTILPYACMRRAMVSRMMSQVIMVLAPVLSLLAMTVAGPYSSLGNLLVGLSLLILSYGVLGYVSWLSHGRYSYAKYFLTVALTALLFFIYLYLDAVSVTLVWFILSILVTAAGFGLPSVSARYFGLGLVAVAVLHYLFTVLGVDQVAGPLFLHDRVWLGLVFALFLPALGLWYREGQLRGAEMRLAPMVTQTTVLTASLIVLAVSYLDLSPLHYGLVWAIAGYLTFLYGRYVGLLRVRQIAIGETILGFVIIFASFFTFSLSTQLLGFLLLALLFIALGLQASMKRK